MLCRNFCGDIAARNDGKRGAERVPNDRSERDNVYILHREPNQRRKKQRCGSKLTWAAASIIVAI
jgi:hypothetical protein